MGKAEEKIKNQRPETGNYRPEAGTRKSIIHG
jgi:hypothetical protein